MAFEVTTALRKMLAMTKRYKVVQGATSSGKTYGIIPILIDRCLATPRLKATVVAETIPAVKDGAVQIFQDFMHDEGRWKDEQWIGNPMEYKFLNGSVIQFKSFDTVGKAKAAGKRQLLFLNEANHIEYPIADALMIRSDEVWIDFNADAEFWAHTEILKQPFADFLKLTYLDNEAIPQATLETMLYRKSLAEAEDNAGQRGYWWNWWQVYGLGEVGNLQGVVFNNWQQVDFIDRSRAKFLALGLDFGFTNDPTALVAMYEMDGELYAEELIYQTGLTNSDIAARMKDLGIGRSWEIVADSAEPKSIEELRRMGFNIQGVTKGPDSIRNSIDILQRYRINVTKASTNLISELRTYQWATDRQGRQTGVPIDAQNHSIDALRYVALKKIGAKNSGRYVIV